ncbi:MAG: MoaD/ThiS family protein [Anaerolineae bacterium]|nr:MoaD/ThiS family protein [Anaerolineae bacterium]
MATIIIPPLMRDVTGGQDRVRAPGRTVRAVLDALDAQYPGTRARLCRGDVLAPTLTVVLNGRMSRLGLLQPVEDDSEIRFLPAIEGG